VTTLATETWTGTNGTAWPAQWTPTAGTGAATIQANAGQLTYGGTAFSLAAVEYLSGMTASRDFDITVDVTFSAPTQEQYFYFGFRCGNVAAAAPPGYFVQFFPHNGTNTMGFNKWDASGNEVSISGDLAAGTWTAGTARRVRIQAIGNNLAVKVWAPGGSEPGTWLWTGTDTTYAAQTGRVLLYTFNGAGTAAKNVQLDNLTVTDGASSSSFTQSASLSGSGTLAATASAAFTRSGALTGTGTLTVGIGSAFTTSAPLTGSGTLGAAIRHGNQLGALTGSGTLTTTQTIVPPMPNQVTGTVYGTTSGGKTIYRYEVVTDTVTGGLTTGQKQAFVYVPNHVVTKGSAKVCLAAHGYGDPNGGSFLEQTVTDPVLRALCDDGWVVISPTYESAWANADSQARLSRAYTWFTGRWSSAGTTLYGFSMGGAISAVAMHKGTVPNVAAVHLVAPVLDWRNFANTDLSATDRSALWSIWGATDATSFATATATWDPSRQAASKYTGQRWRITSSPEDANTTLRPGALSFLSMIAPPVAAQAIDVSATGSHGGTGEFADPAGVVAFYDGALVNVATAAALAGSGALTATVRPALTWAAALTGAGTLTAASAALTLPQLNRPISAAFAYDGGSIGAFDDDGAAAAAFTDGGTGGSAFTTDGTGAATFA
jgi:hypothetical protein